MLLALPWAAWTPPRVLAGTELANRENLAILLGVWMRFWIRETAHRTIRVNVLIAGLTEGSPLATLAIHEDHVTQQGPTSRGVLECILSTFCLQDEGNHVLVFREAGPDTRAHLDEYPLVVRSVHAFDGAHKTPTDELVLDAHTNTERFSYWRFCGHR